MRFLSNIPQEKCDFPKIFPKKSAVFLEAYLRGTLTDL